MKVIQLVGESQLLAGRRALGVIEVLASEPDGIAFSKLESIMGLSAPSLSRLLKMLIDEAWIETDHQGKYLVAPRTMTLARKLSGHWSEYELVEPLVRDLAYASGDSACFARFANDSFVLTAKVEMPSSFHFIELFKRNFELHNNGIAITLMAYEDPELIRYLLEEQVQESEMKAYFELFKKIRKDNYYIDRVGAVTRIAVPVPYDDGRSIRGVMAVASIKLAERDIESRRQLVIKAAADAAKRLADIDSRAGEAITSVSAS